MISDRYAYSEVRPHHTSRWSVVQKTGVQQVKQGSTAPGYTYDADGNRAKAVMGSSTTVYVGAIYEKMTSGSSTTITKYYQAGGQRIALRVNGVVRWRPIIWAARR